MQVLGTTITSSIGNRVREMQEERQAELAKSQAQAQTNQKNAERKLQKSWKPLKKMHRRNRPKPLRKSKTKESNNGLSEKI